MGVFNPMLQHNDDQWPTGQPEPVEFHARRNSPVVWIFVVILAAVLGALIYYGYRTVKTQDIRITQVFGRQGTLNTLGQRADAAESKLHDLTSDWQSVGERMSRLEGRVTTEIKGTRTYAETLTQQLHKEMTSEMESRTSTMDDRLSQIEAAQAQQRVQMAQVESTLKQDIAAEQAANGRDLISVREQEESNARGVSALSERLDRRRVDFQMEKGQTKELIPGVSLQIRGTNQGRQSYHGSLRLQQGQRTVWLREQSAQEPVRFFTMTGGEPYELVITNVTKKEVVGYLLSPVKTNASANSRAEVGEWGKDNSFNAE